MYSCEIDQLLKKNNFNISNEEYKDILNGDVNTKSLE